jgi:transposase-like protein
MSKVTRRRYTPEFKAEAVASMATRGSPLNRANQ